MPTLLIADDDPVIRSLLGRFLAAPGRAVLLAGSATEARALADQEGPVDVALLDRGLSGGLGLDVASELKRRRAETELILLTPYASFESALEALQAGAFDYLSKPIDDFDAVRLRVDNAFAKVQLVKERHLAETEARHLQKMDAIGRLAGGIGHDLANMLAVVLSWVDELLPAAHGDSREGLEEIKGAADRATRLVRHMMTLSRRGPTSPERLSLNHVLGDIAKLLRRSLGARVNLVLEQAPDLWPVMADPSHLGQVCLNLAVNARDAMPQGGTLTFRTENLGGAVRAPGEGLPEGDCVLLTVIDQGEGMSEEVQQRIFEPFFTTKPAGEGTGLGLAIVYGIVRQASGTIQVESAVGRGSTFRLAFPRAGSGPPPEPSAATPPGLAATATGTVLLAEKDDGVRRLLARALRQVGLQVLEARDGAEAVAVASAHPGPLDLLLTDTFLGDQSGPVLGAALRQARERLQVLLMSGAPTDQVVMAFAAQGGEVLVKPFHSRAVIEAVRRLLDRR